MTKVRNLKVTEHTRLSGNAYNRSVKRFPKINLGGKWLQKAGFAVGEFVQVIVTDHAIHIIKKGAKA